MLFSTNPLGKEKSLQIRGSLLTVFSPLSGRHEQSRRQHSSLRQLEVFATSFPEIWPTLCPHPQPVLLPDHVGPGVATLRPTMMEQYS